MALAEEMGAEIARRLGKPVPEDDLGYVALHLAKLMLEGRPPEGTAPSGRE